MDVKRTSSFKLLGQGPRLEVEEHERAHAQVLRGLSLPAALLDASGIVLAANRALAEVLRMDRSTIEGEPVLMWIRRPNEREAFGREFLGLRKRSPGQAFTRDLELAPSLGPALRFRVRAAKLDAHEVLLTFERSQVADAETEFGRAVTRALDGLDQGVLLVDGEGRIVHANPSVQDLLGDAIVGRGLLELAEPAFLDQLGRGLALARDGSWIGEIDLKRLDGETVPVELSLAAGSGEGAPAVVLCRDLRESRRRAFEAQITAQVDRALVSSAEPREAISAACQALARGLGALRVIVLTRFSGHWERWTTAQDSPPRFVPLSASTRPPSAWAQDRGMHPLELVGGHPAPALAALLGEFNAAATGLRMALRATGGVVGYLVCAFDRREPWGDEELGLVATLAPQLAMGLANGLLMLETRALAAYQARVLDQTTVLLNSLDAEGRVVTWNRASERLVGISSDDAKGRLFGLEVARAQDLPRWREMWSTLLRDGVMAREIILLGAEDDEIPVHLEGRLLRDGSEVKGAVLVGLDLRIRRALEKQVLQSQKMAAVGLLAAGIAHEINNPLSGVVGYSKLLLEKPLEPKIREKVERIAASGERCRKIVEGVLLFSRSQQGGERTEVDLATLVDRVVRVGEYQWKMHNVRILREPEQLERPLTLMADADQIEQVLLNLLSNAVDAMPRGGTIRIRLGEGEADTVIFAVSDEGMGIPEEIRHSIFDPFFSTKEIGKGTGLGLSISYGIVRDHGGDILLESQPGRGTTFTVTLPREGPPPPTAPPPSDTEPS
ncbi:sensory box sensor histidine kinase [Plesiocystis pacifica SIR-1]|uniref:histidine kinase n=1 Tax=Plesiocystis pacifica SIR-1 TaxID=391625 RepID=A6GE22_9BACT|nr:ATP-binding protein [Plesiocystis pacifica]EDM75888.1 sensory box sensor histidine kinase [Plesiocystis pacifica SIR-1]